MVIAKITSKGPLTGSHQRLLLTGVCKTLSIWDTDLEKRTLALNESEVQRHE
jgi:hypothetical protein